MKNQITSKILKFAFAFLFILIASSCSEDNDAMDAAVLAKDQINSEISAKGGKTSTAVTFTSSIDFNSIVCIDNAQQIFTLSGWNGTAQLNVQIYDENLGDWVSIDRFIGQLPSPQSLTYTFPAIDLYHLRYQVSGSAANGGTNGFVEFDVNVVNCNDGCAESFSYVANGGGSYTFTYTPAESVTNANLVFTFAQGTYVSGLADFSPAGVTMQKTMDLVACTTYNWTVILQSNCKGGGQKNANVWTEFTVNGSPKKNINYPTITMPCN